MQATEPYQEESCWPYDLLKDVAACSYLPIIQTTTKSQLESASQHKQLRTRIELGSTQAKSFTVLHV